MPPWRTALAGLACVMIAGCMAAPEPTATHPTVPATAPSDVNAQDRGTLRQGGVARMRLAALPTEWNPLHPDAAADEIGDLTGPLSAPAFVTDAAGRAAPNPDLILDTAVVTETDTVARLTLNPDARWGDGEPVTADDWVATWRAKTGQIAGIAPTDVAGWDRVSSVAAGDDATTVVVTYDGPDPAWPEPLLDGPLRAASVVDAEAFSWDVFDPANFAGPYTVAHVDPLQGVITLDPNPTWWGDDPLLDQVIFRTLPDEAAPVAFRNNELDLLAAGVSPDVAERLEGDPTASLRRAPAPEGRLLTLDTSGLLADRDLRAAVLMAIDRRSVTDADDAGIGASPEVWSDPLLLPNQPGYADQARATGLTYAPDRAERTLEEAGWHRNADDLRVRNGEVLTLTFAVDGSLWSRRELRSVTADLAAVGIRVREESGAADLTPTMRRASVFPLAHLPQVAWTDTELTDYATRISDEMDPIRRADQANQLSRLLWQRVDSVLLFQPSELVAVRTGLANVGSGGFASTVWEDVGWQA
ncbi:MAG: ABC transporter substrate-binding protein [Propioniciclava sp.]